LIDSIPHEFLTSERITLDYLGQVSRIRHVFPKHYKDLSIREFSGDREKIVGRLLSYNKDLGAPETVIRNIEALAQPETYAVITGQQPGIFSGPLYTVYKALTTIIMCQRLLNRGFSLVPVFWNASEDHDLHEIDHISIFRRNKPVEVHYKCDLENVAFSHITADKSELKRILKIVDDNSPDSEYKGPLLKNLNGIVDESSDLADFFSRFMLHLFGDLGLIMIEPRHLRDMMAPIFEILIRKPTECTQVIAQTSAKLENLGYSSRIHKKSNLCNFFVLGDVGERLTVTYDGQFQVGSRIFSQEDLLSLLEESPSRFSANAVIRPVTQDYVFPTFAYVSGPNEIAYQAQLGDVYDFLSVETPLIFPRFGATIVEGKVSKVLEKYGIDILELREPERLSKRIVGEGLEGAFKEFENSVAGSIDEVTSRVRSVDENLVEPCSVAEAKIFKSIRRMESKILSELKKRDRVTRQQIFKAYNNLFPYGGLQERHINVLEYLVKFGDNFLRVLHNDFSKATYGEHRVIRC